MRVNPDIVKAEAVAKVERLQKALDALGDLGGPEVDARERPIVELIKACKEFIERAKKRLSRTAVIVRAHEQKKVFETEVQEGEARLKELEAEAAVSVPEPVTPVISDLQRQIDTLVRERDLLKAAVPITRKPGVWMADGPPVLEEIPPMPTTDVKEVEGWLSSRNCELRNALEFENRATITRLGALVAQGSACLAGFTPDVSMGGEDQSSLMSALIDKGDAKRRCVSVNQPAGTPA